MSTSYASYCVLCGRSDTFGGDDPLGAFPLILDGHSARGIACPGCLTREERAAAGWPKDDAPPEALDALLEAS